MFKKNKYTKWYFNIIKNAKNSHRKKGHGEYFENHHIIPECMGGKRTKENMILLTAKEHFICHLLLCNMVDKNTEEYYKLYHAMKIFKRQSDDQNRYFTKI